MGDVDELEDFAAEEVSHLQESGGLSSAADSLEDSRREVGGLKCVVVKFARGRVGEVEDEGRRSESRRRREADDVGK